MGQGIRIASIVLLLLGCGTKTGLLVPEQSEDGGPDALDPVDSGPDIPLPPRDSGPDMPACIPFESEAELADLDIFILLDRSGSMEQATAEGRSKQVVIDNALSLFLEAPASDNIGVALTFFPFQDLTVSEYCQSDADCGGEAGSCFEPDVCPEANGVICREGGTCPVGECVPLGRCDALEQSFCLNVGDVCDDGTPCIDAGFCENRTSCSLDDYRPVVEVGRLPEAARPLIDVLRASEVVGGTPTLPALTETLNHARAQQAANPGNKVIVLLATDGFPSACDDNLPDRYDLDPNSGLGIAAPAAIAAEASAEGIDTFVVGVFSPENEVRARENLSELAMAGGTDEALIVTTEMGVSDRLLRALNDLRAEVRTCVYAIPAAGAVPDPRDLGVRLVGAVEQELQRVANERSCDPRTGGFFFEQELLPGVRPGFVQLCPQSCGLAISDEVRVEMFAGCRPE